MVETYMYFFLHLSTEHHKEAVCFISSSFKHTCCFVTTYIAATKTKASNTEILFTLMWSKERQVKYQELKQDLLHPYRPNSVISV